MNRNGIRNGLLTCAGLTAAGLLGAKLIGDYESIKDIPEYLRYGNGKGYGYGNFLNQIFYGLSLFGSIGTATLQ